MQHTLTSYDDLITPDLVDYCFERVMKWVNSCKYPAQINAALNAIKLFRQQFPQEKARYQNLYRIYWRLKRELNTYN